MMVAVTLADVLLHTTAGWAILVLREISGPRALAVCINGSEAWDAAYAATGYRSGRPRPFEFVAATISALNGEIEYAVIHEVVEVTIPGQGTTEAFVARLVVRGADGLREIDVRPSDAVPVTIHSKRPIYVTEELLRQADLTFPPELEEQLGVGIEHLVRLTRQFPARDPLEPGAEEAIRAEHVQERAVRKLIEHVVPVQPQTGAGARLRGWWQRLRGR